MDLYGDNAGDSYSCGPGIHCWGQVSQFGFLKGYHFLQGKGKIVPCQVISSLDSIYWTYITKCNEVNRIPTFPSNAVLCSGWESVHAWPPTP
jgi:hypothetical protein